MGKKCAFFFQFGGGGAQTEKYTPLSNQSVNLYAWSPTFFAWLNQNFFIIPWSLIFFPTPFRPCFNILPEFMGQINIILILFPRSNKKFVENSSIILWLEIAPYSFFLNFFLYFSFSFLSLFINKTAVSHSLWPLTNSKSTTWTTGLGSRPINSKLTLIFFLYIFHQVLILISPRFLQRWRKV